MTQPVPVPLATLDHATDDREAIRDPNIRRVAARFREFLEALVAMTDIPFHSLCAHHFLPFYGTAHLAYVPQERLVGLSKRARVVDFYARRPQLRERMTEEIAELIEKRLRPAGAVVVIQARHFCMEMRGVAKAGVTTTTSAICGVFEDERSRQKLLALIPARPGAPGALESLGGPGGPAPWTGHGAFGTRQRRSTPED